MKKIFSFIFALLLAASAVSCTARVARAEDILAYESRLDPILLEFDSGGVDYSATLYTGERMRLVFLAPETMLGVSFEKRGDEISAKFSDGGEFSVSLSESASLPRCIFECFSLLSKYESGALSFDSLDEVGGRRVARFSEADVSYEVCRAVNSTAGEPPLEVVRRSCDGALLIRLSK